MTPEDYINSVVGKPWVNRAEGPHAFDCWGLNLDSFRKIDGIEVPQVAGYADPSCPTEVAAIGEINTVHWSLCGPTDGAVFVAYDIDDRPVHVGRVLCGGALHAFGKNGVGSVKWNTLRAIRSLFKRVEFYAANHSQS